MGLLSLRLFNALLLVGAQRVHVQNACATYRFVTFRYVDRADLHLFLGAMQSTFLMYIKLFLALLFIVVISGLTWEYQVQGRGF